MNQTTKEISKCSNFQTLLGYDKEKVRVEEKVR